MIQTFVASLPNGVQLSCRTSGPADAPVLLLLHGFPEAAFIWDEMMQALASHYRCVAPNLRGFADSTSPSEVDAYRARNIAADIDALVQYLGSPVTALVAHDWGGAVAWTLANQAPPWLRKLVVINSPHPATFLRELQHNPAQQQASAYMNFLRRPDAESLLAENDYARAWTFFTAMGASKGEQPGAGWLTEDVRDKYRQVWAQGLTGALNYYRASPLHPPVGDNDDVLSLQLPPHMLPVPIPTLLLWAEGDTALLPGLLEGLDTHVPQLELVRIPQATHWIIHEQPGFLVSRILKFLD